jgi:hypothetical protein
MSHSNMLLKFSQCQLIIFAVVCTLQAKHLPSLARTCTDIVLLEGPNAKLQTQKAYPSTTTRPAMFAYQLSVCGLAFHTGSISLILGGLGFHLYSQIILCANILQVEGLRSAIRLCELRY